MARAEIEQDVGGLPDHELSRFEKRRRERRRAARPPSSSSSRPCRARARHRRNRRRPLPARGGHIRRGPESPASNRAHSASAIPSGGREHGSAGAKLYSRRQRASEISVRRETVEQPVAAGALQVVLRAAAIRAARGMRGVPGFRRRHRRAGRRGRHGRPSPRPACCSSSSCRCGRRPPRTRCRRPATPSARRGGSACRRGR